MSRIFILLALLIGISYAGNNPKPFGFELGKATLSEVNEKLGCDELKKIPEFITCETKPESIKIDWAEKINFYFDKKNKILKKVVVVFPKYRFKQIYNATKQKYTVVHEYIPFVGDRYVKMEEGNSTIIIDAPHLSFKGKLIYITNDELKKEQEKEKEKRLKKAKELEKML